MSQNESNPEKDPRDGAGEPGGAEAKPAAGSSEDPTLEERGLPDDDPEREGRIPDEIPIEDSPASLAPVEGSQAGPASGGVYDEDGNLSYDPENPSSRTMVEPGDNPPSDPGVHAEDPYRVEPYQDNEEPYRYDYYEDGYSTPSTSSETPADSAQLAVTPAAPAVAAAGGGGATPPKDEEAAKDDGDSTNGMLRMSFMVASSKNCVTV
ncbi:MAG: hypothetical protein U5J83_03775 [Bryobacterales bacterium]|nr:hypothetical protein [Bryobacterales bacterium]